MLMSNSLMPAFKNAPKKVKSEKPRKNVKQQKFSKFEGKNCTSNILQKVKCYFWSISIIPRLIPSEMSIEAPSWSAVSEDTGIEPRTVETSALAVRCYNHLARSHPET